MVKLDNWTIGQLDKCPFGNSIIGRVEKKTTLSLQCAERVVLLCCV